MKRENIRVVGAVLIIFLVQAVVLYIESHPFISASGHVYLWEGNVRSAENSQQIFDWYTFSHIIHGFIFYALFWFLFPRMPVWRRLILAVGLEASWEMIENTPWLMEQYRQQALSQGYWGDSILNSLFDTLSAIAGYILASRLPVMVTASIAVVLEVFVGYAIRDNLTLNIINLFHQFDFIKNWQSGLK